VEKEQKSRLQQFKENRERKKIESVLKNLKEVSSREENLMPTLIEAVKNRATLGEICAVLRDVFGVYEEGELF
jgi:methylmalonyl-CoA mutase N-terminal domain/subunit